MNATQGESRKHQILAIGAFVAIGFSLVSLPVVQFVGNFYPQITVPAYCIMAIVCLISVTTFVRSFLHMREVDNLVQKLPARKAEITIVETVDEGTSTFYALVVDEEDSQWFSLSNSFNDQEQLRKTLEMKATCEVKQGVDRSAVVILKISGLDRELRGYPVGGTPAAVLRDHRKLAERKRHD
jgi:hypothetical protein